MEKVIHEFKICPGCDYFCTKEDTDTFCPYCGEKLIDSCPVCGAPIKIPYAHYCKECGSLYPGKEEKNSKNLSL